MGGAEPGPVAGVGCCPVWQQWLARDSQAGSPGNFPAANAALALPSPAKYTARVLLFDEALAGGPAAGAQTGATADAAPLPPQPLQPGMPGMPAAGSFGAEAADDAQEGLPQPEIAAAPPAASTALEAMLTGPDSQGAQVAAVGGQTPGAPPLSPRVSPGLRNPAAADALGDVQVGLVTVQAWGRLLPGCTFRGAAPCLPCPAPHLSCCPAPCGPLPCQMDLYASEAAMLGALGAAVAAADPDILLGYEVQRASLGYAAERAAALGLPSLLRALSRLPRVSSCAGAVGGGAGFAAAWLHYTTWQHARPACHTVARREGGRGRRRRR